MTTIQLRPAPAGAPRVRSGMLLVVLLGGLFMSLLDISIVNVAVGPLQRELHASGAQLQLIVSGYVMSYAVLLILGARLGGLVGHRTIFRIGLGGFVIASAACGFAPTATVLIVFRFIQGAAAAAMLPQVMSLVQLCFPPGCSRARALGWYGLVLSMGTVAGQLLGGILLQANLAGLQWRAVFLVNVPVGLVLLWLSSRALPAGTKSPVSGLDVVGTVLFGTIVGLSVVPLVLGRENGWPLWGFVAWAIAVGLIPAFVMAQRRADAPVIPGSLLRTPGLLAGMLVIVTVIAGYAAYLFAISVHLQTTLGMSPMHTGLAFLPLAIGFAASSLSSPRLAPAISRRMIPLGLLLCVVSFPMLGSALAGGHDPDLEVFALFAVIGIGQGFAITPVMGLALHRVPLERAGEASGVLSCAFQVAQVVGVAGLGSVFLSAAGPEGTGSAVRLVCLVITAGLLVGLLAAGRLLRLTR